MISSTRHMKVWACAEPTSMRKSFDGLYASAKSAIGRDPLDGDLFLFVARDRKQARVLYWDGTGLVVMAKRLEKGRFNAPWEGDRQKPWCLTPSELSLFLEGSRLVGHFEVSPPEFVLGRVPIRTGPDGVPV
jgi:transposase